MQTSFYLLLFALSARCLVAAQGADLPRTLPAAAEAEAEITLIGVLQSRVSIGGETTGWVLRYDKDRTIELTFSIDALKHVRDGVWVTCTGRFETRHYPERGDVRIFAVRVLNKVVT